MDVKTCPLYRLDWKRRMSAGGISSKDFLKKKK
jgi:hypothetical protein